MTTTISIVALVISVLSAAGTILALVRQRRALDDQPLRGHPRVRSASAFARLARGQSAREVVAAVGTPDEEIDSDWFYRLDDHSGYVIELDAGQRVAAVRSWKS